MDKFLLVASDVHSDETAFETLCQIANSPDCLAFLYCGDLDTDNYFISTALRNRNFVFVPVQGNCDSRFSYIDILGTEVPLFRTYSAGGIKVFLTHGHMFCDPQSAGLDNKDFDFVLNGHSHVCGIFQEDSYIYVNPGSPSKPRGGSPKSYALITLTASGPTATLHTLPCRH